MRDRTRRSGKYRTSPVHSVIMEKITSYIPKRFVDCHDFIVQKAQGFVVGNAFIFLTESYLQN